MKHFFTCFFLLSIHLSLFVYNLGRPFAADLSNAEQAPMTSGKASPNPQIFIDGRKVIDFAYQMDGEHPYITFHLRHSIRREPNLYFKNVKIEFQRKDLLTKDNWWPLSNEYLDLETAKAIFVAIFLEQETDYHIRLKPKFFSLDPRVEEKVHEHFQRTHWGFAVIPEWKNQMLDDRFDLVISGLESTLTVWIGKQTKTLSLRELIMQSYLQDKAPQDILRTPH